MKKTGFLCILLCTAALALSQEAPAADPGRDVPPAPVVSGLSAVCSEKTVTLSWYPAPGIEGENIILRSDRPVTASNYTAADKLGSVPVSATTFTDSIEDGKEYYYAILTRDSSGTFYEFFLPASNALLIPVSTGKGSPTAAVADIDGFDALNRNDAVIITWTVSVQSRNLVLYRSTAPFTGLGSLIQSVVVSSFQDTGTPFVDYPVPGVPYYYALADEDVIRSGTVAFTPGKNTNRIPVEIPSGFSRIQRSNLPGIRPMPLPWLNPSRTLIPEACRFSEATEAMIAKLSRVSTETRLPVRTPYVFRTETGGGSGGEDYALRKIIEGSFSAGRWETATGELKDFLSLRRTAETTARARFYLGESFYFSGKYRLALLEFLLSEDVYYNQSREWIRYVLERSDF